MPGAVFDTEISLMHCQICCALADPKRIMILYLLHEKKRFVNELVAIMGCPQSTVSRHLGVLREQELITATRQGTTIYYEIADERIIEALNLMRDIVASKIASKACMADCLDVR